MQERSAGARPAPDVRDAAAVTARGRAKADRRATLLAEAARLFARHGFDGASIEDLGAAAGVSGPAVYRHFASKQAVLGALLVGASRRLHEGGHDVVAASPDAGTALRDLVRFHVAFALRDADVIRVQDRDLHSLTEGDRRAVRALQRGYVDLWVGTLARLAPETDAAELRLRAQATFGLMNSTPHSARAVPRARVGRLLETMALEALGHGDLVAREEARAGSGPGAAADPDPSGSDERQRPPG